MARTNKINLKKIIALSVIGYMAIVVLFYYLAGEQLHFRDSRGNIEMKPAESSTLELTQDNVVEQLFTAQIQRLEEISVQWGNYYRQNSGMATIELYNNMTGELLLSKSFDVSSIKEGDIMEIKLGERVIKVRVVNIAEHVLKNDASSLYEVIN